MKPIEPFRSCKRCLGTGKIKNRKAPLLTKDTRKMMALMKKYDLNQLQLAKILNISQSGISDWFRLTGKINEKYFIYLKLLGYK